MIRTRAQRFLRCIPSQASQVCFELLTSQAAFAAPPPLEQSAGTSTGAPASPSLGRLSPLAGNLPHPGKDPSGAAPLGLPGQMDNG
jgi:hypothetical protein